MCMYVSLYIYIYIYVIDMKQLGCCFFITLFPCFVTMSCFKIMILDHFSTEILKPMVSWRYTMTLEPPSFTADSEGKKELEWYEYPPIKQPFRVYLPQRWNDLELPVLIMFHFFNLCLFVWNEGFVFQVTCICCRILFPFTSRPVQS